VWSAGREGRDKIRAIDPHARYPAIGDRLELAQLWHLVRGAKLLVAVDTSVSHLGRLVGTPTVTLFGPSSAALFGAGDFWAQMPNRAVTIDPFPCRDQRTIFKRELDWVRRCQRSTDECAAPRCMHAIEVPMVERAVTELLS
jgi:ADP-heptose:LPS heptosyltransferase